MRIAALSIFALLSLGNMTYAASDYHLTSSISIPGAGGWDYLTADSQNRRLYVSHGTVVDVVDLDSEKVVGQIPNTNGVHGIAIANDLGKGFISAGRDNQVVIFDLKTLSTLGTAKTGANPDGIVYEPATHRVFAFNGRSHSTTVIDAKDGSVVKTIDLEGNPNFLRRMARAMCSSISRTKTRLFIWMPRAWRSKPIGRSRQLSRLREWRSILKIIGCFPCATEG